ncbi:Lumazine-binding protein [Anaeromyces robustus]|uniref:Lumazine-binding protein n=1 Tax=Anaeromyces robustus TaxID=1754192 RepID=A0A1Y1VSL2_9FUNG|nr:Lumazine-binding protein [Anaeromyces robustus]|eukprot:ORX64278.1 Lumazine-binding protein [Anaeromyces robustus]
MFTGIVEIQGKILSINKNDDTESGGKGFSLVIGEAESILGDCHLGDSIAVNGTCLTVTEFNKERDNFKVNIAPETVRKTNLGLLKEGSYVNLERAMSTETRFGGHLVQGHVNTTVKVDSVVLDPPNSLIVTFYVPEVSTLKDYHDDDVMLDILPKGFVCLDGVSLTITNVNRSERKFSVMLIPHTQKMVTLGKCQAGDIVNIEVDNNTKTIRRALEENGILQRVVERQDKLEKELEFIKNQLNSLIKNN